MAWHADAPAAAALVASVIGRPYAEAGMGPAAFNCWGLARHAWSVLWGLTLPFAPIDELIEAAIANGLPRTLRRSAGPAHGALGFTSGTAAQRHVCVYLDIDRGRVLHALEGHGVVCWSMLQMRVYGFREIHWYLPRLSPAIGAAA